MNHRALVGIIIIAAAIAGLLIYRDMYPDLPTPEDVAAAKIAVYNDLIDMKERRPGAETYAYIFVHAADRGLIPSLVGGANIVDASKSEIKNGVFVSKTDAKPGIGFEAKLVTLSPNSITLLGKRFFSGTDVTNFKYTLERNQAARWKIVSREVKQVE